MFSFLLAESYLNELEQIELVEGKVPNEFYKEFDSKKLEQVSKNIDSIKTEEVKTKSKEIIQKMKESNQTIKKLKEQSSKMQTLSKDELNSLQNSIEKYTFKEKDQSSQSIKNRLNEIKKEEETAKQEELIKQQELEQH